MSRKSARFTAPKHRAPKGDFAKSQSLRRRRLALRCMRRINLGIRI